MAAGRGLTTSNLLQRFSETRVEVTITPAEKFFPADQYNSPAVEKQEILNNIASDAANLPHGVGAALNKTATSIAEDLEKIQKGAKQLCESMQKLSPKLDTGPSLLGIFDAVANVFVFGAIPGTVMNTDQMRNDANLAKCHQTVETFCRQFGFR